VLWVFFLLFCQALFIKLKLPGDAIRMAVNLALILIVVRFASFYIKSRFWARAVSAVSLVVISLRIFKLWQPIVDVLNGITISLGAISFSVWGLVKSFTIFAVLWALASAANRFFAHWLTGVRQLTYSDRVLFQRLFNTAMVAVVILVSLHAAGIHMAAIAVTGGAIGIAIGVGLQRIGSNLVSGILLLINKPIRQGDVVTIDDAFSGTGYGWITRMDLMYVHLATRDGTEHLIPNETFVTQEIENLSYSDNRVRLRVPFGIAYKSDLQKASKLALEAARATDRVLKAPEPACVVTAFGESSVMLEVRVWIEDPRQGVGRVNSNVFLAIWDIFHANGIELPFPQRDLHIIRSGRKGDSGPKAPVPPTAEE
jgi:small-conductance mechanosensitive channel